MKIDKPDDADAAFHREWMFLTLRTDWTIGGKTWKAGSLLAIKDEAFAKGDRKFDVLFEPTSANRWQSFTNTRSHLILNELDNVSQSFVRAHAMRRKAGSASALSNTAPLSSINAIAVDPIESDDYFLVGSNYLTPSTLVYATFSR